MFFFEHESDESNESFRLRHGIYIRGIREIRGQLNIIHTRICFFSNTNRTNNTNLASAWHLLSLGQYMLQDNGISKDNLCKDIGK